jgi:anti-anti-sigma factor
MSNAQTQDGVSLVRIDGEMTIYTALACRDQMLDCLQQLQSCDGLDIDLSGVTEVDSAGMQLLIQIRRHGVALGKPVRLLTPSAALQEMISLYRLGAGFDDPRHTLTNGSLG